MDADPQWLGICLQIGPEKRACIDWFTQLLAVGNSEGISKNDVVNDGN